MKDFQSVSRGSFGESLNQYNVEGIMVDEDILLTKFACDYSKCNGACCWANLPGGTEGCPITQHEANKIREYKNTLASKIVDPEKRRLAFTKPVLVSKNGHQIKLTSNSACIYSDKDGCICKQLFGLAPQSCSLYPLGVNSNGLHLYHDFDKYCKCGYTKGEAEGTYLIDFLEHSISRIFGKNFFEKLKRIQNDIITSEE